MVLAAASGGLPDDLASLPCGISLAGLAGKAFAAPGAGRAPAKIESPLYPWLLGGPPRALLSDQPEVRSTGLLAPPPAMSKLQGSFAMLPCGSSGHGGRARHLQARSRLLPVRARDIVQECGRSHQVAVHQAAGGGHDGLLNPPDLREHKNSTRGHPSEGRAVHLHERRIRRVVFRRHRTCQRSSPR